MSFFGVTPLVCYGSTGHHPDGGLTDSPTDSTGPAPPGTVRKRTQSGIGRFSKRKGSSYERHIVKLAAEVFKGIDWPWQRTPRSGGWVSKKADFANMRADIIVPDTVDGKEIPPHLKLFIECKKRESWSLDQLFRMNEDQWGPYRWLVEAGSKARGRVPVLFFSRNGYPDLALINRIWLEDHGANGMWPGAAHQQICLNWLGLVVLTAQRFLEVVRSELISALDIQVKEAPSDL